MERLEADELVALIERVFEPEPDDTTVAVLVDLPDAELPDNDAWASRRSIAAGWVRELQRTRDSHPFDVDLVVYRNVRANNADLPESAWVCDPGSLPTDADELPSADAVSFDSILSGHRLVLAPTELSATVSMFRASPQTSGSATGSGGSEIVGLVPLECMLAAGRHYLKTQNKSAGLPEAEVVEYAIRSLGLRDVTDVETMGEAVGLTFAVLGLAPLAAAYLVLVFTARQHNSHWRWDAVRASVAGLSSRSLATSRT